MVFDEPIKPSSIFINDIFNLGPNSVNLIARLLFLAVVVVVVVVVTEILLLFCGGGDGGGYRLGWLF